MPNFNYGNMKNAAGNSIDSPEDQLFQAVLDTLAYEGFLNVTEEALEKKGTGTGLLEKYASAWELCEAVLIDAAERIRIAYESVDELVNDYLAGNEHTYDLSYMYLERLIYRHIYICFHPANRKYVLVCLNESQLPEGLKDILPDAMWEYFEKPLAELILAAGQVKNRQIASLLACSICGSVAVFVQQPRSCRKIFKSMTGEAPNYAVVEDFLNNMFLRNISVNTDINKPF